MDHGTLLNRIFRYLQVPILLRNYIFDNFSFHAQSVDIAIPCEKPHCISFLYHTTVSHGKN